MQLAIFVAFLQRWHKTFYKAKALARAFEVCKHQDHQTDPTESFGILSSAVKGEARETTAYAAHDVRCWMAIFLASVFGTNLGDLYAHESGLGIVKGLLIVAALALLVFFAEQFDALSHEASTTGSSSS